MSGDVTVRLLVTSTGTRVNSTKPLRHANHGQCDAYFENLAEARAVRSARHLNAWRTDEAAELAFKKLGEGDCRKVLKIRPNDLHANRQTIW